MVICQPPASSRGKGRNLLPPMRREISRLRASSKWFPSTPIPARSSARDDGGGGRPYRHFDGGSGVETSYASNGRNAALHPPLVISTVAGQPPIGKPLIVQARGQLRLTWRLYAESPQSGEISLLHGQESMEAEDLSTQSIIEAVFIYPPYRHVPSLEMTVAAGTPLVISTKAERSGEISLLQ